MRVNLLFIGILFSIFILGGCVEAGDSDGVAIIGVPEMSLWGNADIKLDDVFEIQGEYIIWSEETRILRVSNLVEDKAGVSKIYLTEELDYPPNSLILLKGRVVERDYLGYTYLVEPLSSELLEAQIDASLGIEVSREAIKDYIDTIIDFDWGELSFDQYKRSTEWYVKRRTWKDKAIASFSSPKLELALIDLDDRKLLYKCEGPMLPPFHWIVFRFAQVYVVYDISIERVDKLLLTIEGWVEE